MKAIVLLSLGLLFISSCSMLVKEVPSEKKDIIEKMALDIAKKNKTISFGKSSKTGLSVKKGQWITTITRMKSGNKDVSLNTMKVIDIKKNQVTLEIESYSAENDGKLAVTQMTFENYPLDYRLVYKESDVQNVLKNVRLVAGKTKMPDGTVQELPVQMMAFTGQDAGVFLKNNVAVGEISSQSCATNYFKSSACLTYDVEVKVFGFSVKPHIWAHSAVPLGGQVKSEDENSVIETVAFGLSGAKSLF